MKVLVIPDVHLKPWMFVRADEIMAGNGIVQAVCLMDIADDWQQQFNLDLYAQTYDAAIRFAKDHPETFWCYGNHDLCYEWNQRETGYSRIAQWTVCRKLCSLREAVRDNGRLAYIHRIDSVLFMHGGLSHAFVMECVPEDARDDADAAISHINGLGCREMWKDKSPLWCRPQDRSIRMYKEGEYLQVVGHTPVRSIYRSGSVLSCDVFSTDSRRKPYGTQEFPVIDTETWEFVGIR